MQAPVSSRSDSGLLLFPAAGRFRVRPAWLLAGAAILIFPGCAGKKQNYETVNYEAAKLATPPHNMKPGDYPFDASGRYRKDWVKSGGSSSSSRSSSSSPGGSSSSYVSSTPPPAAAPAPAPAPAPKPAARYHTVNKGDTLYGIGRKYGVSVPAIKSTNGLRSDLIRIGQTLRIPG